MPADTLLQLHDRNVRLYSAQVLRSIEDLATGIDAFGHALDALPDAAEAVRANPLSADAGARLLACAEALLEVAIKIRAATLHAARCREFGVLQMARFEARLAELRESTTAEPTTAEVP